MLLPIGERGSKIAKTVISVAICPQLGDKFDTKTLFSTNCYLCSSESSQSLRFILSQASQ